MWVRLHSVKKHTAKLTTSTKSISSSFKRPEGGVNSSWKMERRVLGAMVVCRCVVCTLLLLLNCVSFAVMGRIYKYSGGGDVADTMDRIQYQMKAVYKISLVAVVVVVVQKTQ